MEHFIDAACDAPVIPSQQPGFHLPFAVAAPVVALMLAVSGWSFSLNARMTALETIAQAPSKDTTQLAALNQKVIDFQEEYERDRINDRVASAREGGK